MDSSNETEIPMLPISNPSSSIDELDISSVILGYTGPLRTQRRTPFLQMSGPLFATRRPQSQSQSQSLFLPLPTSSSSTALDQIDSSDDEILSPKQHFLRSEQLGMRNDPCPPYYSLKSAQFRIFRVLACMLHTWARRFVSSLYKCLPGIMKPQSNFVQNWTKFLAFSSFVAIFIDPLFLSLLFVQHNNKCIGIDWPMTKLLVSVRSITDLIFSINIFLQFRLAYVAPESRVVGAGKLVDQPRKIASHYFWGKFFLDLFIVLPLPQIMILSIIPAHLGKSRDNSDKHILRTTALFQYLPKLYRLLPLLAGQSSTGFIFESSWANFVINFLTFMLAGNVVGSCWYLSGLQSVKHCLVKACNFSADECRNLIDCARGNRYVSPSLHANWRDNARANACFQEDGFTYGIYLKAVNLTNHSDFFTRYSYSLFWGFQQISTLAGNLVPSYSIGEVLFTFGIIGLGLFLFAQLIGNMHNFLQALDRRRLEMTIRRRDVEQWMSHRRFPEDIRKRVREVERFEWAATRGVNEDLLFENMPDDLQRDIRRHLFKFLRKVKVFSLMEESILDAISERLKQRTYIRSSTVFHRGDLVKKMVFIVRGEMESIEEDGTVLTLSEGDICGEELLTLCLQHSAINPNGRKLRMPSKGLVSYRYVRCLTNVEAFSLSLADLEDVTSLFSRFLRSQRVQRAIRSESPYWKHRAATHIQLAWRYRKRRLQKLYSLQSSFSTSSGSSSSPCICHVVVK